MKKTLIIIGIVIGALVVIYIAAMVAIGAALLRVLP